MLVCSSFTLMVYLLHLYLDGLLLLYLNVLLLLYLDGLLLLPLELLPHLLQEGAARQDLSQQQQSAIIILL